MLCCQPIRATGPILVAADGAVRRVLRPLPTGYPCVRHAISERFQHPSCRSRFIPLCNVVPSSLIFQWLIPIRERGNQNRPTDPRFGSRRCKRLPLARWGRGLLHRVQRTQTGMGLASFLQDPMVSGPVSTVQRTGSPSFRGKRRWTDSPLIIGQFARPEFSGRTRIIALGGTDSRIPVHIAQTSSL